MLRTSVLIGRLLFMGAMASAILVGCSTTPDTRQQGEPPPFRPMDAVPVSVDVGSFDPEEIRQNSGTLFEFNLENPTDPGGRGQLVELTYTYPGGTVLLANPPAFGYVRPGQQVGHVSLVAKHNKTGTVNIKLRSFYYLTNGDKYYIGDPQSTSVQIIP